MLSEDVLQTDPYTEERRKELQQESAGTCRNSGRAKLRTGWGVELAEASGYRELPGEADEREYGDAEH